VDSVTFSENNEWLASSSKREIKIWGNSPDLNLKSSDISFSKENIISGETVTIYAEIHNIGLINATNAKINFYDGKELIGSYTIDILVGETNTASVEWNIPISLGTHTIYVKIDEENNISEENETNNNASVEINIEKGDNLPPENPTFSPKNSEKINTKRPKITITFAEEVTVTEVKLNGLNIYGNLKTNDNFTFTYTPIVDLPEGDNTISIKAKDLNGNEMSEPAICTFTIEIDETPPEISEIKSIDITQNSASITWKTNEKSTSQIEYGTTETYGKETTIDENFVNSHSITMTDLEPNTTYHFRVKSIDEAGNENISEDYTFKTLEKSEEINIDVKLEIDKTEPKEGEMINITAKVTNNRKTSIEISVIFYDNDKKIEEKKISIASGKSGTSFCNWKAEGKGTHEIKVVIMYDGKEIKNVMDSKNVEVKEVKGSDSGFNMIYLIPIIIVPIIIVIGLVMRNRVISQKQIQSLPIQQQQVFQEISQTMTKQPTTQHALRICPFCNAQVPREFKFCNMCGKVIEPTNQQIPTNQPSVQSGFKVCPFCNAQVPGEFKYCNMCGKQIEN